MAKGLRATTRKRNKTRLRETVYGPADQARTERLSAKLQELANKPLDSKMTDIEGEETENKSGKETEDKTGDDAAMDVDGKPSTTTTSSGKIQKRRRYKRPSKIVFAPHPQKAKRSGKK